MEPATLLPFSRHELARQAHQSLAKACALGAKVPPEHRGDSAFADLVEKIRKQGEAG